jgi:hypothetical protein
MSLHESLPVDSSWAAFKKWILSKPEDTHEYMLKMYSNPRVRRQVFLHASKSRARLRWSKVRWAVKVRPYGLHWLREANERLCAPGKSWSERDKRAYAADFDDVAEDDAPPTKRARTDLDCD